MNDQTKKSSLVTHNSTATAAQGKTGTAHHADCGEVGDTGDHGDLGTNSAGGVKKTAPMSAAQTNSLVSHKTGK